MNPSVGELQERIRLLEEELIHVQRQALLGQVCRELAHELNNLMTPVLSRADFALSTGRAADQRKALELTKTHVERVQSLLQSLRDLPRGPAAPRAHPLAQLVSEALTDLVRSPEKDGINTRVEVPADLAAQGSRELLLQVLLNLLLNAREALRGKRGTIEIRAAREGELLRIDVRDTGQTMTPAQYAGLNAYLAAADPGASAPPGGIGLDVQVCRLILLREGARLEAKANEGPGCTFRLYWPAAQGA